MSKVFKNPQEKVCFVIPIHPPNYRFLPNLKNITKKSGVKIFLVLTEKDSALEQKYTCFEYIYFDNVQKKDVTNWPTEKKFLGTQWIFNNRGYEYVISCDAEIKLANIFDQKELFSVCEDFFSKKRFYGGGNADQVFQKINIDCMKFLKLNDKFIRSYSDIYFWFSELPIYEKSTFIEFFENQRLDKRSYEFNHYDHLIYAYWLCANKNFHIVDWNQLTVNQSMKLNCSGELINSSKFFDMLKEHKIDLHWLSHNYARHIKRDSIFLKYHVDRPQQRYIVSNIKKFILKILRLVGIDNMLRS